MHQQPAAVDRPASHTEPARQTPIVEHVDVVVCGSGPAGVCAAIAAARQGASVRLIEAHGCLGGVWTSGLLAWVLDAGNKAGLMSEILARLDARAARRPVLFGGVAFDVEQMKLLLEEMCAEAGVRCLLHTCVVAAARDGENRLAVAITENKSGRQAWAARAFVDCTGDGDLAASAGCGFDLGRPTDGQTQPMSLLCLVAGVRYDDVHPFVHDKNGKGWRDDSKRIIAACEAAGFAPSYGAPVLFMIHDDLYALMANHEYGGSATDAQSITDNTLRARAEVHRIVAALRDHGGPGWAGVKIVATADQIGVREGRRVRGRYTVTRDDVVGGARFDDAVCRVTFPVDVHATSRAHGTGLGNEGAKAQPYDVPLRALIAADVDGLLMAGRCISGDFIAHASYRVTGNAAALGEAAGVTVALAARFGVLPHDVPFDAVGSILDGRRPRQRARAEVSVSTLGLDQQ